MVFCKDRTPAITDKLKALRLCACVAHCVSALSYYSPQERLLAGNPYKQITPTNISYRKRILLSARHRLLPKREW
jgi:hypothetical protein